MSDAVRDRFLWPRIFNVIHSALHTPPSALVRTLDHSKLDRQSEPVQGNFTLVLRKIDGRWVIVHDHTSRLGE
jgi:ketosteroid isomerase-like protein